MKMYNYKYVFSLVFFINYVSCDYFLNKVNHIEYYRNRTRPSKSFSSFSSNYFNQNSVVKPIKGEKVLCGTRSVDFNPRRMGKIVGGTETPYGAFPWQVSRFLYNFFGGKELLSWELLNDTS